MKKIRYVRQGDYSGCGIACIAMLKGKKYNEIKSFFKQKIFKDNRHNNFYTSELKMIKALRILKIKIKANFKIFKSWKKFKKYNKSLVGIAGINYRNESNKWHWVIFCKEKDKELFSFDPQSQKINGKRTDFSRMEPYKYLLIN